MSDQEYQSLEDDSNSQTTLKRTTQGLSQLSLVDVAPKRSKIDKASEYGNMPPHLCDDGHLIKEGDADHRPEEVCRACGRLAISPRTVLECGHTYGKILTDQLFRQGTREIQCVGHDIGSDPPQQCTSVLRLADLKLNRAVDRGINQKIVYCPNKPKGCNAEMKLRDEAEHLNNECRYQSVKCRSCKNLFARKDLAIHEESCTAQRCQFSDLGCEEVLTPGDKSATRNLGLHLAFLIQTLANVKALADFKPKEFNTALTTQAKETQRYKKLTELMDKPDKVQEDNQKIKDVEREYGPKQGETQQLNNRLIKTLQEDLPLHVASSVQRMRNRQQFLMLHEEITNETMGAQMADIQRLPIWMNYGSVIMKVENYTEKRVAAIQGTLKKGIYGPPFLTHEYGYKMVPILYPNGDGSGAGTHLSIFLAVMKSEYDGLLRWPMTGRITLSILTQKKVGRELVKHTFRTDVASQSYYRPTGNQNQASGIPRALDLQLLRQPSDYLVDDTLFIQVNVEPQLPPSTRM